MAKIFLDPGHGGYDAGASGKRSKEKDNVLKIGLRLRKLLEAAGHTVKMSRTTDVFVELSERARLANSWGAHYFVSLHNNSGAATASGFETFVKEGATQTATLAFQAAVHKAIASKIGIKDRGKKKANYAVLRETAMPAILIEYAFISNMGDESILTDQVEQLAQWTADGIKTYAGGPVTPVIPKPPLPIPTPLPPPAPPSVIIVPQKEEPLYKPSASAIVNSTATVLKRLEQKEDQPLDPQWRQKLLKGELTLSDAIGLLYVAIDRGFIEGKTK